MSNSDIETPKTWRNVGIAAGFALLSFFTANQAGLLDVFWQYIETRQAAIDELVEDIKKEKQVIIDSMDFEITVLSDRVKSDSLRRANDLISLNLTKKQDLLKVILYDFGADRAAIMYSHNHGHTQTSNSPRFSTMDLELTKEYKRYSPLIELYQAAKISPGTAYSYEQAAINRNGAIIKNIPVMDDVFGAVGVQVLSDYRVGSYSIVNIGATAQNERVYYLFVIWEEVIPPHTDAEVYSLMTRKSRKFKRLYDLK